MGEVHFVTPDKKKAYAEAIAVHGNMGKTMVVEGFDDTPDFLYSWNKTPQFIWERYFEIF